MAFVTTTSPDVYAATTNLEEIPAGADVLQYADDDKMNQIRSGLLALHGWASGVPISETANGHFLAMAAGSSAAVSVAAGVRLRQSSGAIDYSYNTGAYVRLLSKLTLASQATGDLMYASDSTTWARLAAGTNGYVLTMSGGLPVWAAAGGGGGGIAAGDNVTWTGNHAWNTGTAAFGNSLGVTGTLTVTGGATISTTLGLAAGAAATPSLYQTGDTNTGVYFPAADQFAITTGGTARLIIDGSTELHSLIQTGPAGSASLPTFGFTGDPNTGAYNVGADQYGITTGGTLRLTVSTTDVSSTIQHRAPAYRDSGSYMVMTYATAGVGKAIFGTESANALVELQSYKGTSGTGDGLRVWCYSGVQTAGNLASFGDAGTYAQKFAVDFAGRCDFATAITQTTVGGAGAAEALPGVPTGYLQIRIGGTPGTPGTIKLVPYWDWDGP